MVLTPDAATENTTVHFNGGKMKLSRGKREIKGAKWIQNKGAAKKRYPTQSLR